MKTLIYRLYIGGNFVTYVLIFSASLSLNTGCKKDLPIVEDSFDILGECSPIMPCNQVTIGGGYTYIFDLNSTTTPFFNPNNDNEFLFVSPSTENINEKCIRIFNLQTKNSFTIYTGSLYYAPQWSMNDWILFCQNDKNIYKIKSNGDSLTQLTNENCYHYPQWFFEENKFVAYNECLQKDVLFSNNGTILDTLPKLIGTTTTFAKFPYLLGNGGISGGVLFYNFQTNTVIHQYDYSQSINSSQFLSSAFGDVFWINYNEVIYSNINGLNRLSIPDLSNQNFKKSCNAKVYQWGDINSSKTKMIWSRSDYVQIDECTLKYKSRIFIMNVDGTNEQEIQLN